MEESDAFYIKAFNSGYLLAKYEPELAAKLANQENNNNEYHAALILGKQQFEKEVESQQWAKSFSKGKPSRDDKNLDKER